MNVDAFVNSLQYMGKGMAGIFIVTLVLILAIVILNALTKDK